MVAIECGHENRTKYGKDRKGNQRWKCQRCGRMFASNTDRPLGDMRTDLDDAERVLKMLLEGMSIRACERITDMKHGTICDLVLHVGENCDAFLGNAVRGVRAEYIELDEIWGFVYCKRRQVDMRMAQLDAGDCWTWLAIDAQSKLVLSHAVGSRDATTCVRFLRRLNNAVEGECQVTSDGLGLYTYQVPHQMGSRISFAQLIKSYKSTQVQNRYSPAQITGIEIVPRVGDPDPEHISTSYSERLNLSVRMHNRRLTRLTNAHSKSEKHHAAMMALFVAWYNYCRAHETLAETHEHLGRKVTPAMAAGLTDRPWTLGELLRAAAGA
jgi:transposase-like protein/IS1 family transposase